MVKLKLHKRFFPDQYWIRYTNEAGVLKQVSLAGCANSFKLATGNAYDTGDGLKAVGWRYEENGCLCYEIFSVGHLQLYAPLQPSLVEGFLSLLRGKEPKQAHKDKLEAFERALNRGGWKTVERPGGV